LKAEAKNKKNLFTVQDMSLCAPENAYLLLIYLLQSPTQHLKVVQRWPWLLAAMVVERMLR
jgi:hypothetical protein